MRNLSRASVTLDASATLVAPAAPAAPALGVAQENSAGKTAKPYPERGRGSSGGSPVSLGLPGLPSPSSRLAPSFGDVAVVRHLVRIHGATRYADGDEASTGASRGCSSMVEPQPSKLVMRVRFPSSALLPPWLVSVLIRVFEAGFAGRFIAFRAINGPLADRHQDARRAVVIIVIASALSFDVRVDVAGDDLVCAARLVLVDQGSPL